jgi:UDP-N-acetylmuramoyl-tripeptide--D-alanyl-D-alanine ligase
MLELGEHTPSAHAEAVARALDPAMNLNLLVLVGPQMARAARGLHENRIVTVEEPSDRAVEGVARHLQPGDCVLLKGSRRMRLERVLEGIRVHAVEASVPEVKAPQPRRHRPGVARAARRK